MGRGELPAGAGIGYVYDWLPDNANRKPTNKEKGAKN